MHKETSSRVSTIAAHIMKLPPMDENSRVLPNFYNDLLDQAQTLAGSALSQDEHTGQSEIHPAPAEFTPEQIAQDQLLHFFHYAHLPPTLQATSKAFFLLAHHVVSTVPRNPERTVALRKLLEAKDAAVRANLPIRETVRRPVQPDEDGARAAVGKPVEIGGHDQDRDGPIPFDN